MNVIAFPDAADDLVVWCRENPEEAAVLIERSIRALRTLTKVPRDAERETIARIIDPEGFSNLESEQAWAAKWEKPDSFWRPWQDRCDKALAKADAILALPSIPPREGPLQSTTEQADASRDHPVREAVQDTWFTDRTLPIIAMSGDVESDGVLKLHFRRKVTDADRARLVEVLNAGETALSPSPTSVMPDEGKQK